VRSIRQRLPDVFIDVHLAVAQPGSYIKQLAIAGASQVCYCYVYIYIGAYKSAGD
jgi:pentose-5-phosphate-3-epimerase